MKTCLVAGGAGFIGSHLCDRLIADHFRVVCVDNLLTGRKANIEHLIQNQDFVFIEADITDPKIYVDELNKEYDAIFHLASPASPNKQSPMSYLAHPVETMLANSVGTHLLLDLAKKQGAKFLFASTSEVYGDPKEHPQKETYWGNVNPNGVRSCYDESKRFGEAITMVYRRLFNLDTRIVRIFNTYGPRMDPQDGRVIVDFVIQALKQQPFTVYGNGVQTRSFCYVSDLVEGIIRAIGSSDASGEVINLGNEDEYTINDLVEKVAQAVGVEKKIVNFPLPEDDPLRRQPDISKAKKLFNWQPQVSLIQGLEKTITYFRDHLPA